MQSWSPEEKVANIMRGRVVCSECDVVFRPREDSDTMCAECDHRVRSEAWEREKRLEAVRRVTEDLPGAMALSGVPKRYQRLSRASWEAQGWTWPAGASDQLEKWGAGDTSEWLVFVYGLYGRRKTGLATAMLSEWLLTGARGKWVDQNDWLRQIKAGFNGRGCLAGGSDPAYNDAEVFDALAKSDLIVFDDLGAVRERGGNEWWKTMVAELFRYRHAQELPTIVTSNVSGVEDLAAIDGSLVSRMDVRMKFHLTGHDYRKGDRA